VRLNCIDYEPVLNDAAECSFRRTQSSFTTQQRQDNLNLDAREGVCTRTRLACARIRLVCQQPYHHDGHSSYEILGRIAKVIEVVREDPTVPGTNDNRYSC
jgi:hypothetical protein